MTCIGECFNCRVYIWVYICERVAKLADSGVQIVGERLGSIVTIVGDRHKAGFIDFEPSKRDTK